ncbi:MAG: hypothetical protein EZS26_001377 [Candidatus Ordinivivax streblomastigis]|uniref:Uncharacterized protein n=1 Tax=Candidatus Ordinivivax streblomastigis TaxID=2540710 RepID=A0A5M8P253_9BACT|nr:MAG: hypothetical protein EZS26_001377 [Candidatus Ordinivivax streblomastigis]
MLSRKSTINITENNILKEIVQCRCDDIARWTYKGNTYEVVRVGKF